MPRSCVIGWGIVGQATGKGLGISDYIDLNNSTISLEEAAKCQFVFLCLPTPTVDGKCDVSLIREYIEKLVSLGSQAIFVIRSTVIPGTAQAISQETGARVVSNPEFLSEDTWEQEALHPGFIVIGADDPQTGDAMQALYEGRWRGIQIFRTNTVTAEMIKYALNVFYATKVIYGNALFNICQEGSVVGANYETIKSVLEFVPWGAKNHFTIWHKGGRGAGGRCLAKDLEAFANWTSSDFFSEVQKENRALLEKYPKQNL